MAVRNQSLANNFLISRDFLTANRTVVVPMLAVCGQNERPTGLTDKAAECP